MSSEESVTTTSSRLRQFGLYRTIDSRTEEFLKLSRRRQIRQGCACAAVSTAITVTVVVSVLLVYEYGFHMEPELTTQRHKPNWYSMLNDTETSFDNNLQTSGVNINRSIKLLPILLRALKQNRFLEKVIEEYSSQTPVYDKQTTDYPIQRNIFTDARNWIRMPPSKMYAIEYKTSPIVFFKTRNLDNFAKSRKVMDSQRITNYLDRMLNDKISGSTVQLVNEKTYNTMTTTVEPIRGMRDYLSMTQPTKAPSIEKKEPASVRKEEIISCKCPNNLGDILNKLINSIQQLIPTINKHESDTHISTNCTSSKSQTTKTKKVNIQPKTKNLSSTRRIITTQRVPVTTSKPDSTKATVPFYYRASTETINVIPKLNFKSETQNNTISHILKLKYRIQNIEGISDTFKQKQDTKLANGSDDLVNTTTTRVYIETPDFFYYENVTPTEPMRPIINTNNELRVTTIPNFLLKRQQNKPSNSSKLIDKSEDSKVKSEVHTKSTTDFDERWWFDEDESNISKTTASYLKSKFKESQRNKDKKFEVNHLNLKPLTAEYPVIKTYSLKKELKHNIINNKSKLESSTKKTVKTTSALKIKHSEIDLATHDTYVGTDFGAILPTLIEPDIDPVNLTAGLLSGSIGSREIPISLIPQIRPPFLEIRRNEGTQQDHYYDEDTLSDREDYD